MVDQIREANRWITWIDAETGAIKRTYNALTEDVEGRGLGVKGDRKRFDTVRVRGGYRLRTTDFNGADTIGDTRQTTRTARNTEQEKTGPVMFDRNNVWNLTSPQYRHPDQRPGVDAHYYANVVDDFYADVFGRNSLDDEGLPSSPSCTSPRATATPSGTASR